MMNSENSHAVKAARPPVAVVASAARTWRPPPFNHYQQKPAQNSGLKKVRFHPSPQLPIFHTL
jgi:hypothetical protein